MKKKKHVAKLEEGVKLQIKEEEVLQAGHIALVGRSVASVNECMML